MAGMANQMRSRALKATSATRSNNVIKKIKRCDIVELNRSIEPIIRQNERERIASEESVASATFGWKI